MEIFFWGGMCVNPGDKTVPYAVTLELASQNESSFVVWVCVTWLLSFC